MTEVNSLILKVNLKDRTYYIRFLKESKMADVLLVTKEDEEDFEIDEEGDRKFGDVIKTSKPYLGAQPCKQMGSYFSTST